jgi:hypothetical protein
MYTPLIARCSLVEDLVLGSSNSKPDAHDQEARSHMVGTTLP